MQAMKSKTSWSEKLQRASKPRIVEAPANWNGGKPGGKMLIPSAHEMQEWIRQIPDGKTRTVKEMRNHFARIYGADITCPLTSGIFLRIIAEGAEEDRTAGRSNITPYWRVVGDNGKMPPKIQAVYDRLC
jgi:hypothetical protein